MSDFNPSPNEELVIGGHRYKVMPHPAVPTFAFGQEGRKAFVFQVSGGVDQGLYALKKFKDAYRVPELVEVNQKLARFSSWPGLEACQRACFEFGPYDDVLNTYPDLEFAVLMPWIAGRTWYDIVIGMTRLTRLESLTFANSTARVLAALEESSLAHCDIAAANVIVNGATGNAHLIDVEDIYAPGFAPPGALPAGTDGYAHQTSGEGQWKASGDRFSGAVIIAEMAAWHVPEIRKKADEEHYFGAHEMQVDSPRYQLMVDVLDDLDERLVDLFMAAWFSDTLEDCPSLRAWQEVVEDAYHRERVSGMVSGWQPLVPGGSTVSADSSPPPPPEQIPTPVDTVPEPAPEPVATVPAPEPAAPTIDDEEEISAPEPADPSSSPTVSPPPAEVPVAASNPITVPQRPASSPPKPIPSHVSGGNDNPVVEWRPLTVPSSDSQQNGMSPQFRAIETPVSQQPESTSEPIVVEPIQAEEEPSSNDASQAGDDVKEDIENITPYDEDVNVVSAEKELVSEADFEESYDNDLGNVDTPVNETYLPTETSGHPQQPLLQVSDREEGRPILVWTEVMGAVEYELEEAIQSDFSSSTTYVVEAPSTTWVKPKPRRLSLPFRRPEMLFYRVRAWIGNQPGRWSDVLAVELEK